MLTSDRTIEFVYFEERTIMYELSNLVLTEERNLFQFFFQYDESVEQNKTIILMYF